MTTQTMKNAVTTALKAVDMAPPEKLFPARAALATKLDQIERAQKDLSDFTARAERAGVDENRALEDETLSESEALEAIQTAQMQKSVFKARIAAREKAVAALSKELGTAVTGGVNELRGLVNAEVERREGIIGDRIVEVLQTGKAIDPTLMTRELAQLLAFSGPLQVVNALAPPSYVEQGNTENLVAAAREILGKFERVIVEAGKKL